MTKTEHLLALDTLITLDSLGVDTEVATIIIEQTEPDGLSKSEKEIIYKVLDKIDESILIQKVREML